MPTKMNAGNRYIPFHSPLLFQAAIDSWKSCPPNGLAVVILCASALEAFTNDVAAFLLNTSMNLSVKEKEVGDKLDKISSDRVRDQVQAKFLSIFEIFDKTKKYTKGDKIFQELSEIIRIRNEIVHAKTEPVDLDVAGSGTSGGVESAVYPKFVYQMQKDGILEKDARGKNWMNLLDSEKFCSWCLKTTDSFINSVLDIFPNTAISSKLKEQIRFTAN